MTAEDGKVFDKYEFYNKAGDEMLWSNTAADFDTTGMRAAAQNKATASAPIAPTAIPRGGVVVGGTDCANASSLDADFADGSVTITGDTTGAPYIAAQSSDPALPPAGCEGTFSQFDGGGGQWFTFTGSGTDIEFVGCTSAYDTTFSVMTGDCSLGLTCVGGDDDACGIPNPDGADFASSGVFSTTMGTTYYILVHGYLGAEGAYTFTLNEFVPATVDCSMTDEYESDGDGDRMTPNACIGAANQAEDLNAGCNAGGDPMVDFDALLLNGQTCGTVSTESVGGSRDLDWYTIDIPDPGMGEPTEVTLTITATGPVNFFQVTFDGAETPVNCAGALATQAFGDAPSIPFNDTLTGTACLAPGQYVVAIGNQDFSGFDCPDGIDYSIEVVSGPCPSEACCLADGTCVDMTNPECVAAGGVVQDGTDCATLAVDNAPNMACSGYCCVFDLMGGTATITPDTSENDCNTLIGAGSASTFFGYNLTPAEQMDAFCEPTADNISCDLAEPVTTDGTVVMGDTRRSTYIVDPSINPELPGAGCGTTYGGAPGLWYSFVGTGNTVDISMCGNVLPEDEYDGKIYVFCGDCTCLFCVDGDDDGCSFFGPSEVTGLCTEMGTTYKVLVAGFGEADAGMFGLSITDSGLPCMDASACVLSPDIMCTPDDVTIFAEFLEDCTTNLAEGNDGCDNATAAGISFSAEDLDLDTTVCGNIGARTDMAGTITADQDWFVLYQETGMTTKVQLTLTSEAPASLILYNYLGNTGTPASDAAAGANCDNVDLASGIVLDIQTTDNGQAPAVIEFCLTDGQWFVEVLGTTDRDACAKDDYTLQCVDLGGADCTGACCQSDGTCTENSSEVDCLTVLAGVFTPNVNCADQTGGMDAVTCMGACCTLAAIPGDPNDCAETDFDSCTTDPNFLVWNGIETTCADMDVDCGTRPANDDCDGAIALDTMGTPATVFIGNNNLDNAAFYSIMGTGNSVTVSLCNSTEDPTFDPDTADGLLDTFVNVFCRGCDEQRFLLSGDDECPDGMMGTIAFGPSEVTFCTEAGTEYLIEVGIFLGEGGTIEVSALDDGMPCVDAPDCTPSGACCLDAMTSDCVVTTQLDCETNLLGTFAGDGTDCGGPTYTVTQDAAMPFTEIGPTSTPLTQELSGAAALLDDEAAATVLLPFDFNYFGVQFLAGDPIYMHVNGFATFENVIGSPANLFTNQAIPSLADPGGVIAPEWDDFITNGNASNGLFAATDDNGTPMDTSDDSLTLEWNVSPFAGDANITFQLVLNADNSICFRYGGFFGASPSAGLENADGSAGVDVLGTLGTITADDKVTLNFVNNPFTCPIAAMDGACCIAGSCSIMTEADCLSMMGEYGGDGTTCMDVSCNDCPYDVNNTGAVDIVDFTAFSMAFNSMVGDPNYDPALDFNNTGAIDIVDFTEFSMEFNRTDCYQLNPVGP